MKGIELVVVSAFGDHNKGDIITDEAKIKEILDGTNWADVIKRKKEDPPAKSKD